jgi:hypothetical protein
MQSSKKGIYELCNKLIGFNFISANNGLELLVIRGKYKSYSNKSLFP